MIVKYNLLLLILLVSYAFYSSTVFSFVYHSFVDAMKASQYSNIILRDELSRLIGIDGSALYLFFEQLYEQRNFTGNCIGFKKNIPKIIHYIWLGSDVPKQFHEYVNSWKIHHPDWKHMLWTDKEVAQLTLHNQDLYDKAQNFGQKSDIARYEILYQFGGLYVDIDFECLQPFDVLHERYDFYTGILPLDTGLLQLGNGLIGSRKHHPFLWQCIIQMKQNKQTKNISIQTGPLYFTKQFYQYSCTDPDTYYIAFPAFYFYPLGSTQVSLNKNDLITRGAWAVHHWAHSWCDKSCRRAEFVGL